MMHNTILFATDFSTDDQPAFDVACRLATKSDSRLLVLHVRDPGPEDSSKLNRKDPNVEFVRYIPKDLGVSFDHVVKIGAAHDQILAVADSENVDMIILGTHERSGLSRAFVGSVAGKVLRNANSPVMTVRDAKKNPGKREVPAILVPVDFSVFGYAAMDYATKLALSIGATMLIVHVDEAVNAATRQFPHGLPEWSDRRLETLEQLRKFVPQNNRVAFGHKLLTGDAATAISDYANSNQFDFIVLGTHGRTGLGRALLGSVAESVVRRSNCPVISVKPSNKRTGVSC